MSAIVKRHYGWRKPTPEDIQKYEHEHPIKMCIVRGTHTLYPKIDLREWMPPVYNQENLGSCTANALAALYEFYEIKQKEDCEFPPSRLWVYYWERVFEGTVNEDSGAIVATGIKVIKSMGVCPERVPEVNPHKITSDVCWPYDVSKFTNHPPVKSVFFARKHKAINASRIVQSLTQMKQQLQDGHPIVFGFMVYESFEGADIAKDGLMHMPDINKESLLGGHCVLICGYDDTKQIYDQTGGFLVRNSWGEDWGEKGYFWMPYSFAVDANMCSDHWTIDRCMDKY